LVTPEEILKLRRKLKEVAENKAFLLQGGDCAESFSSTAKDPIEAKLKVLLKMSLVLIWGANLPVVRIARMAGQFAKPRSKATETLPDGRQVLSFRGENINGIDIEDRAPDPRRLVRSYFHSAATLNYSRSLLSSGFADLQGPQKWLLGHVKNEKTRKEYKEIVDSVLQCLHFVKAIGADNPSVFESVDLFTSHEALLLDYESALTREYKEYNGWFDTSAHFVWVGERTRQLDHGHIEYIRGIENPMGIKIGPTLSGEELIKLLDIVDSKLEPGKVTLISRYGVEEIAKILPLHIKAVQTTRHKVVWSCDPMHGNTKTSIHNPALKTRHFSDIVKELEASFKIHKECNSQLNGLHFELTGEVGVTECVGGSMEVPEKGLEAGFKSFCDPRFG
jgi:3-deoxy-7-phosphoheptulonate synthase